jgi:hypothetical protein
MEWPQLDELKQVLDVTSEDWDGDADETRLTRLVAAAIDRIKIEIAGTTAAYDDRYTEPLGMHSQAALRMAELLATRPAEERQLVGSRPSHDPTIRRLLYGQRRRFGVA